MNSRAQGVGDRTGAADDRALLRRARDADAINELLRRFWAGLVAYAERCTRSRDAAEDVVQEVFLGLWEGRLRWDERGSPRAFLYGVARNLSRRQRRWREVRLLRPPERPPGDASGSLELASRVEVGELRTLLVRAVAALPPRRQEIFTLARVHGFSYADIAHTMGISVQTVANQMSAALASLRRALRPWLQ